VFYRNSLAFIFSERHLNLKMIILTSFSFRSVLTSRSNFTIVFLFKCSYLNNYTRQLHEIFSICSVQFDIHDVCKNRKSHFMSLMQVFSWLGTYKFEYRATLVQTAWPQMRPSSSLPVKTEQETKIIYINFII